METREGNGNLHWRLGGADEFIPKCCLLYCERSWSPAEGGFGGEGTDSEGAKVTGGVDGRWTFEECDEEEER